MISFINGTVADIYEYLKIDDKYYDMVLKMEEYMDRYCIF